MINPARSWPAVIGLPWRANCLFWSMRLIAGYALMGEDRIAADGLKRIKLHP